MWHGEFSSTRRAPACCREARLLISECQDTRRQTVNCSRRKWWHQWTVWLYTDLIYILFQNSSCLRKWKAGESLFPHSISPLLLVSLCFSTTRHLPCKFKKLCQILIIVSSNTVASLLVPPQQGATAHRRKSGEGEKSQREAFVSFEQLLVDLFEANWEMSPPPAAAVCHIRWMRPELELLEIPVSVVQMYDASRADACRDICARSVISREADLKSQWA